MNVLITGHAGFLGSNLTLNLLKNKYNVIGVDLNKTSQFIDYKNFSEYKMNLLNKKKISSLLKNPKKIDMVIHTAAVQPSKKDVNFEKYVKTNLFGTKNLVEACKDYGIKKIIFCSSFSVYGNYKNPIKESIQPIPQNTYGLSKYLAENLLKYFANKFNMNIIILRFDGIYGNGQNLPGFMKMSFDYATKNKRVLLFSKGKLKRDHVYIIDAVKAINLAIKKINKYKFEIFNIGGNNPTTAFNIFKKIKMICKSNSKIILSKKKSNFSQDIFLDVSKAKNFLKYKPNSLDNNLKKMFCGLK